MAPGSNITLDFSSPHVVIILIVLIFILLGMGTGMSWNLYRTLREDDEEIAASRLALIHDIDGWVNDNLNILVFREKSLGGSGAIGPDSPGDPELPTVVPPHPRMKGGPPPSSSYGGGDQDANGGCYVPDGGFPFNSRF